MGPNQINKVQNWIAETVWCLSIQVRYLLICDVHCAVFKLGLQRYIGVPVHHDIFCHIIWISYIYWTSYHSVYDTFTYASANMGKHCLQVVLTLLLLFSPYVRRFYEQTDEKNPCWDGLVSRTDFWAHEQDMRQYPSCFVVMYCDNWLSGYVSYHAKLYHCRPSSNHMRTWKTLIELTITTGVDEGGTCKVLENKLEKTKVDIWYSGAKV